jgi:hypothetical protein
MEGDTEILYAGRAYKEISGSKRYRLKQKLQRRASVEPCIGRLKARFRLGRSFLKGLFRDMVKVPLGGLGDESGELDEPVFCVRSMDATGSSTSTAKLPVGLRSFDTKIPRNF